MTAHEGTPARDRPFATWPVHDGAERALLLEVLESGTWSYEGPKEKLFEERFARFCETSHALCVTSGTTALEIGLRGLGIGPGDQVIVPALTWTAPAWAVIQSGADVVFADVGPDWCLDPGSLRSSITASTKAVIIVHTYDQVADVDKLIGITREHDLLVLEDCAHTPGSRWRGHRVGGLGHAGAFSFQLSKCMTAGEGGALVTGSSQLADRFYSLRNCGRPAREELEPSVSGNQRMTEFQAAILLAQLDRLETQARRRATRFAYFREAARAVPGLMTLPIKPEVTQIGMFAFPLEYRPEEFCGMSVDVMVSALNAEGVPARRPHRVVYQSPLWRAATRERFWHPGSDPARRLGLDARCPTADHISNRRGLILPHQLFLGEEQDVDDVIAAFQKVRLRARELVRP